MIEFAHSLDVWLQGWWHRRGERQPLRFLIWVICVVVAASLFEIIPLFLIQSNIPTISVVKPYSPLELLGRDIYIENGCYNCHSQMIRPILAETEALRRIQQAGANRFTTIRSNGARGGSARTWPAFIASKLTPDWHIRHFRNPRDTSQGTVDHARATPGCWNRRPSSTPFRSGCAACGCWACPIRTKRSTGGIEAAQKQADGNCGQDHGIRIAGDAADDKKVIALIAYLNRLGRDIAAPPAPAPAGPNRPRPRKCHRAGQDA